MPIFMCLGVSLGTAIGVATKNLPTYLCLGMSLGLCIGSLMDANKKKKSAETDDDCDATEST